MSSERIAIYQAVENFAFGQEWMAFIVFGERKLPIACHGSTRNEAFDKAESLRLEHIAERQATRDRRTEAAQKAAKKKAIKDAGTPA